MQQVRCLMMLALLCWGGAAALAQDAHSVTLTGVDVTEDTTLYNSLSALDTNSGGNSTNYAGNTNGAGPRRLLIRFDLSSVPSNATITGVSLTMRVTKTPTLPSNLATHALHRVTNSWVEGTGLASGSGGQIVAGAATWNSREHPTVAWNAPGGDFVATPSASINVGTSLGAKTWSGEGLVADVQVWVSGTQPNFGWIIIGNESVLKTARVYGAGESLSLINRPSLAIDYTAPPPEPGNSWILY